MKTLVFGGSLKPERYSNIALHRLQDYSIPSVSFGLRRGEVAGVIIDTELINYPDVHTITLYLNAQRQVAYYEYFLGLQPKRVIFNPGTENPELEKLLEENGIAAVRACTLVLLSTGQYEKRFD